MATCLQQAGIQNRKRFATSDGEFGKGNLFAADRLDYRLPVVCAVIRTRSTLELK
jgi:hypothetical protein